MRYVLIFLAVLAWLIGSFLAFMFTGMTETIGFILLITACFFGILARIDQADHQHKKLIAAVRHEPEPRSRADRQMDSLVEQARR